MVAVDIVAQGGAISDDIGAIQASVFEQNTSRALCSFGRGNPTLGWRGGTFSLQVLQGSINGPVSAASV